MNTEAPTGGGKQKRQNVNLWYGASQIMKHVSCSMEKNNTKEN